MLAPGGARSESPGCGWVDSSAAPGEPLCWAMARLEAIPGLVHEVIASFLAQPSLDRLASTSRWARASAHFIPSTRELARGKGLAEVLPRDHAEALGRLLLSRGGGACKALSLEHGWAVRAMAAAFSGGQGAHLTSLVLHVSAEEEAGRDPRPTMELLGQALPLLPSLRRLVLRVGPQSAWTPVWHALGAGACPQLEELEACCKLGFNFSGVTSAEAREARQALGLVPLAQALEARLALGLAPLRWLEVETVNSEALMGLSRVSRQVQRLGLGLSGRLTEEGTAELVELLLDPDGATLTKLDAQRCWLWPDASSLILALVQSRAAATLEELRLQHVPATRQALDALHTWLASTACRATIKKLGGISRCTVIDRMDDPQEFSWEALMESAGGPVTSYATALTDRPGLEELVINDLRAEASDFIQWYMTAPPSLSSLRRLQLRYYAGPSGLLNLRIDMPRLETLRLCCTSMATTPEQLRGGMQSLADALPSMPALTRLEIEGPRFLDRPDRHSLCLTPLIQALETGAARGLHTLNVRWYWAPAISASLLQALADGACPKLRDLTLGGTDAYDDAMPQLIPAAGQRALACLLDGSTECSATLEVLNVHAAFAIDEYGALLINAALDTPACAQPRVFVVCMHVGVTVSAAPLRLIDALARPRAASRLEKISMVLLVPSLFTDTMKSLEPNAAVSVSHRVLAALSRGTWPCMTDPGALEVAQGTWDGQVVSCVLAKSETELGDELRAARAEAMYGAVGGAGGDRAAAPAP